MRAAAEHAARASRARLVSLLAAEHGDIALAEDAVGAAFERALLTWPRDGIPANPEGWLLTVARNVERDAWKSAAYRTAAPLTAAIEGGVDAVAPLDDVDLDAIPDRRLALLFTCAHPAIDPAIRTPLMLQTVLGFESSTIAAVLALAPATLAKRLVRAKHRIRDARIPFVIPDRTTIPERLPEVLEAVYGCFAIAWSSANGASPDLTMSMAGEALYLAATLAELLENEAEAWGLAALMAFSLSRAKARTGPYIPLDEQDPATWDAKLIADGESMLRRASALGHLGRFQLEAALQAVHADRRRTGETDVAALATLSTALLALTPSVGARIAHAAIITRLDGADAGLALLDALGAQRPEATRLQAFHATRAEALLRSGRACDAAVAFTRAVGLADDERTRAWLQQQRQRQSYICTCRRRAASEMEPESEG